MQRRLGYGRASRVPWGDGLGTAGWKAREAHKVYDYARDHGVNVTLKFLNEEDTGAEHCQHDNPTIGQETMADWLVDIFGIDERVLIQKTLTSML